MNWRPKRISRRAVEIAVVLVLLVTFSAAAADSHRQFAAAKRANQHRPFDVQSSAGPARPVFDVVGAAPGDTGASQVVLVNVGTRPARILAQRIRVRRSALDRFLSLSIYDMTTRECIFPRRARPFAGIASSRRVVRPRPSGPCVSKGAWTSLPASLPIVPRPVGRYLPTGPHRYRWRRAERHRLHVRWWFDARAPNSVAGTRSSFAIRWRAVR